MPDHMSVRPKYRGCTIVFDLDGTLIDTAPDLTAALNHVLDGIGRSPLPASMVRGLVGHGARALVERGMASSGLQPTEAELQTLLDRFLEYYGDNIATLSRPFACVEMTLEHLRARQALLAVCTNKPAGLSNKLFAALGMSARFAVVLGGDSLPVRKPDPLHVIEAIRQAGGDPARAVMVGDSAADINAARAAGVPSIAVSFGYTLASVYELGADLVIDRFDELIEALPKLLRLDPRG